MLAPISPPRPMERRVVKPLPTLSRARPLWLSSGRVELLWCGLFALFVLGVGIGLRDPWPSDEPRFALVAHWMVGHGQWLFRSEERRVGKEWRRLCPADGS